MKMNKKVIASALTVAMGAGLVGSISGTVAWYQYSTRATVQMLGASIGVSKNLQVAIYGGNGTVPANLWKQELKTSDIMNYLDQEGTAVDFKPITTSGVVTKDAGLGTLTFKGNPRQYVADPANWIAAKTTDYVSLPLYFRSVENNGTSIIEAVKNIGLLDAKISNKSVSGKKDISNAVRIAIEPVDSTADKAVLANVASTATYGKLDLNGDGEFDREWSGYSEADDYEQGDEIIYGTANTNQTSYNLTATADKTALFCTEGYDSNGDEALVGGKHFGKTTAAGPLKMNVTIWLEGWQKLDTYVDDDDDATGIDETESSAMWSIDNYVGSQFHVGFTFACADKTAD